MSIKTYNSYPLPIVLTSDLVSVLIYGLGIYIVSQLGTAPALVFLAYILWLEFSILRNSCRHCFYYGKVCAFGKGKLCAMFFKKGDHKKFSSKKITWRTLIPDFLVLLVPLLCGIFILIQKFNWQVVLAILALMLLGFMGNSMVRGSLACRYCKQRERGCPAEKLFRK